MTQIRCKIRKKTHQTIQTYRHTHTNTTYVQTYACMRVCVCASDSITCYIPTHVCMHAYIHACLCAHVCVSHACVHMYVCHDAPKDIRLTYASLSLPAHITHTRTSSLCASYICIHICLYMYIPVYIYRERERERERERYRTWPAMGVLQEPSRVARNERSQSTHLRGNSQKSVQSSTFTVQQYIYCTKSVSAPSTFTAKNYIMDL